MATFTSRTLGATAISFAAAPRGVTVTAEVSPAVRRTRLAARRAAADYRYARAADPARLDRTAQALARRIAGEAEAGTLTLFLHMHEDARRYFRDLALEALKAAGVER